MEPVRSSETSINLDYTATNLRKQYSNSHCRDILKPHSLILASFITDDHSPSLCFQLPSIVLYIFQPLSLGLSTFLSSSRLLAFKKSKRYRSGIPPIIRILHTYIIPRNLILVLEFKCEAKSSVFTPRLTFDTRYTRGLNQVILRGRVVELRFSFSTSLSEAKNSTSLLVQLLGSKPGEWI
jgi:hypothetical protein